MHFDPGIDIVPTTAPLGFSYGVDCFGPEAEIRHLDAIRKSLLNPYCSGPEEVYAIAMDVGKNQHQPVLEEKMLLFGVVTYASGQLGHEPVRSQGHVHKKSVHSGWSPPEVYEIWAGKAIIYMQEYADDDPGRCFAIYANPGDVVVVPPEWAHATISADSSQPLTFGAWCDREYGFLYDKVRQHHGLAWYPLLDENGEIHWKRNEHYHPARIIEKSPEDYASSLHIDKGVPIYIQFEKDPGKFQFVSQPGLQEQVWIEYIP